MRISIIGAGHVGLVTGVCLAEKGHQVVCVDVDPQKVASICRGVPSFHEKGLEDLLRSNLGRRFSASTDVRRAVIDSELSFIAVGTPFDGRMIDLTYVRSAAQQLGRALEEKSSYHVVVMKSTVVPGTTDEVVLPILELSSGKRAGEGFGVGMNPEFLTEGEAIDDFMQPDRLVLGGADDRTIATLEAVYAGFSCADRLRTNNRTAEMIKYASNCFLATLISFSNEMGNLCAAMRGVDVVEVLKGVHLSKYLSPVLPSGERVFPPVLSFLAAGCGFGGSCLPKDTMALIAHAEKHGLDMKLLKAVVEINRQQPGEVLARLDKHFSSLDGVRVAVLGLAFRPDTDDMRESPAIPIVQGLLVRGANVRAYDPAATVEARKIFPNDDLLLCDTLGQALERAQAVVLVTRWEEFEGLPQLLDHRIPQPVVVDGRRMLDRHSLSQYEGIGL